jgi:hypothetical protein
MIIAIHQPNYIPWLGYFDKMQKADIFVYLDDVQYVKGTVANRNYVKGQQGKTVLLSVPVKLSDGAFQHYNQIGIDYSQNWMQKHLNQIKNAYYHSPRFHEIYPEFEQLIKIRYPNLAELNITLIDWMKKKLEIQTKTVRSSELAIIVEEKNERNLAICKKFDATLYLSGKGAESYNDPILFERNGIHLKVNHFKLTEYSQLHGDFLENLSGLDYLFNHSNVYDF